MHRKGGEGVVSEEREGANSELHEVEKGGKTCSHQGVAVGIEDAGQLGDGGICRVLGALREGAMGCMGR